MKKLFSIFLIFSFVFNVCGHLLLYEAFKYSLKNNAKEKINSGTHSSKYVLFVFANAEMKKEIPDLIFLSGKEFSYKGEMFDVVSRVNKNDSTYFYCLPDKDEDRLNLAFNTSTKENNSVPDKKSTQEKLTKNIISESLLLCSSAYIYQRSEIFNDLSDSKFYPQGFKNIPTPPPNLQIS